MTSWDIYRTDARKLNCGPGTKQCGNACIPKNKKCRKGGAFPARAAIATGLGVAGIAAGAYALRRRRITPVGVSSAGPAGLLRGSSPASRAALPGDRTTRALPGDRTTRRITGTTPYGLLPPRPPKSKTQRMRENTALAARGAERAIGRAARAEITRAGAVANAMTSAGEATGMATKTTMRELRLRVEAARRRFEPGYRRGRPATPRPQPRLPESGNPFAVPFRPATPRSPSAESIPLDPRPRRRRRARGFGRSDSPWAVGFDAEDGKKYTKTVTNPETGRKNKVRYGAKGYTIAPGTDKGDRYCLRSYGQMKMHNKNCSGPDKNTPLCLSRAKWRCSGKTSNEN